MDAAVTTLKFESKAVIPTDPRTKLFLTVKQQLCFVQPPITEENWWRKSICSTF